MVRSSQERLPPLWGWKLGAALCLGGISYYAGLLLPYLLLCSIASMFVCGSRSQWGSDRTASAYSVFNEGGARLQGTFTSEQFDAQLRGRAAPTASAGPLKRARNEDAGPGITAGEKDSRRAAAAAAAERRAVHTPG
mmetsp:Transcript_2089/g.4951  ORF Transcript_2089/g.4951 Transcript_2089/m.4951 type:complete len:137 (-) Transcript_2089:43-453(-)